MPRIFIFPVLLGLFSGACFPFTTSIPFSGYLNDEGVATSGGMLKGSKIRSRVSLLAAGSFLAFAREYCSAESEYDKTGCGDEINPTIQESANLVGLSVAATLSVNDSAWYRSMGNCATHVFFQTRTQLSGLSDKENDDGNGRVDFAETRAQIRQAALFIPLVVAGFCSETGGGLLEENDIKTSM